MIHMDNYGYEFFRPSSSFVFFPLFYIATCEFLMKGKICHRLLIFKLSDKETNLHFL